MVVLLIVSAVLTSWVVIGALAAVAFGQAARLADAEHHHRAEIRATTEAHNKVVDGLLRKIIALSGPAQTANVAALDRAERFDPNSEFRAMMTAQARMVAHDENGHVPVGAD